MKNNIADDFALLEELAYRADVNEQWVDRSLEWLSIEWNQILADNLYNYLLLKQDGNFFLPNEPFVLPSRQEQINGNIDLGTVLGKDELRFKINEDNFDQHILISGRSGTGKSNLIKKLAEGALESDVCSVKIFDPKKEYQDVAMKHRDILFLDWRDLKIQILKPPPAVPIDSWIMMMATHLAQTYDFLVGATEMILRMMNTVIECKKNPCISDLLNLQDFNEYKSSYKDNLILSTVLSRLRLMKYSFGEVVDSGFDVMPSLMENNFILQTSGLGGETEGYLMEYILIWCFMHRLYNPEARNRMSLFIADEAQHRLFNANKEINRRKISSSIITMLVDQAREMNIALVSATQEPSSLIGALINNSFVKIAFHHGSGVETKVMKEAMSLNQEQTEALQYLRTGEAIVRMPGRFMDAFPVKIDVFKEHPCMNDAEFWQHQKEMKERLYRDSGVVEGGKASEKTRVGGNDPEDDQNSDWETYDVL